MASQFKRNNKQNNTRFKRNNNFNNSSDNTPDNNLDNLPVKRTRPKNGNGNKKVANYFLQLIKDNDLIKNNGKSPKNNGRKAKLTPNMQINILEAIELGMPVEAACHLVKITPVTYYNWLKWGEVENNKIKEDLGFIIEKLTKEEKLSANPLDLEEFIDVFVSAQNPTKFFYFFNSIETAKAQGHAKALKSIRKATDGGKYLSEVRIKVDPDGAPIEEVHIDKYMKPDWNAGAWYLERKFPDLYSQKTVQENTGNAAAISIDQMNIQVNLSE